MLDANLNTEPSMGFPAQAMIGITLALALASAPALTNATEAPVREEIVNSSHFLHYHPDLRHRKKGFAAIERNSHDFALRHFRRAAWFADKPSQAMIAEMYWNGHGVAQDRALAYA